VAGLGSASAEAWRWWRVPRPPPREQDFREIVETNPPDVRWHTPAETARLLSMMTPVNLAKVAEAQRAGGRMVGGVYRRTRPDAEKGKTQRAEVRFDSVAGCLRTPAGGSSRQTILVVEGEQVRSRLLSGRETARLMGLPDSYQLPERYNDAYHLTGDGVVVPAVRHLCRYIFEPILAASAQTSNPAHSPSSAFDPHLSSPPSAL
jgi:DNA (cytosine-5)-methyltransferase 1